MKRGTLSQARAGTPTIGPDRRGPVRRFGRNRAARRPLPGPASVGTSQDEQRRAAHAERLDGEDGRPQSSDGAGAEGQGHEKAGDRLMPASDGAVSLPVADCRAERGVSFEPLSKSRRALAEREGREDDDGVVGSTGSTTPSPPKTSATDPAAVQNARVSPRTRPREPVVSLLRGGSRSPSGPLAGSAGPSCRTSSPRVPTFAALSSPSKRAFSTTARFPLAGRGSATSSRTARVSPTDPVGPWIPRPLAGPAIAPLRSGAQPAAAPGYSAAFLGSNKSCRYVENSPCSSSRARPKATVA